MSIGLYLFAGTVVLCIHILSAQTAPEKHSFVVGIDFGTSYSGLAYSFLNATDIKIANWEGSYGLRKTPTTLLLTATGEIDIFGYTAEKVYALETENTFRFFKNFKMVLHNNEEIKKDTKIKDDQGHSENAIEVFSDYIKFLKDYFLNTLGQLDNASLIKVDNIKWVLTVPAIWNDQAKQFMREAAEMAGIPSKQLILALEPEVAALWAKETMDHMASEQTGNVDLSPYDAGTRFMVIDMGGGKIDITVQEVLEDRRIKQLCAPNGGSWGGLNVNKEIHNLFHRLIGKDVFDDFEKNYRAEAFNFTLEIEMKKKFDETDRKIVFKFPAQIAEIYQTIHNKHIQYADGLSTPEFADKIEFIDGRMTVDTAILKQCFQPSIDKIINLTNTMLSDRTAEGVKDIILVGGFSGSNLVINALKNKFANYRVVILGDVELAVLKGAVIYGHNPSAISSRISKYTYGTSTLRDFIEGVDPENKRVTIDRKEYCKDVFNPLVQLHEILSSGKHVVDLELDALSPGMASMDINLYKSYDLNPRYVTDDGCINLGKLVINETEIEDGWKRNATVQFMFGDSEIKVVVIDKKSKRKISAMIDMLH